MNWSLNELEALCRKAARGAGYSWGLAEEAGKATRWLAATGLPGPACLLHLLEAVDQRDFAGFKPDITDSTCTASHGFLCPLLTGAALCDGALGQSPSQGLRLVKLSSPLLLLPFVVTAFETAQLRWTRVQLSADQGAVSWKGVVRDLACPQADVAVLEPIAVAGGRPLAAQTRAILEVDNCTRLEAFAHRTFAPATEASRLVGAGAGLSDND
ncbi:MAG: DUF3726 domain-containing protein [Paracoccaceae bacterium]|nr:DUF3726 domain-containing protein [Paracoccaceae bacterium]